MVQCAMASVQDFGKCSVSSGTFTPFFAWNVTQSFEVAGNTKCSDTAWLSNASTFDR